MARGVYVVVAGIEVPARYAGGCLRGASEVQQEGERLSTAEQLAKCTVNCGGAEIGRVRRRVADRCR